MSLGCGRHLFGAARPLPEDFLRVTSVDTSASDQTEATTTSNHHSSRGHAKPFDDRVDAVESVNFDRAAGYYDATRALPAATMARADRPCWPPSWPAASPSLEIGVGTGRFALPLRAAGIAMAGTDISAAMLRRLAANAGGRQPAAAGAGRRDQAAVRGGDVRLGPRGARAAPDPGLAGRRRRGGAGAAPGGALVASFPTDNRRPARRRTAGAAAGTAQAGRRRRRGGGGRAVQGRGGAVGRGDARGGPRHGMVRTPFGAQTPRPRSRATWPAGRPRASSARCPVRTTWTLGEAIDHVERQLFSWSWPFSAAQAAAVAGDVRGWAAETGLPLETAHETETAVRCWAFELRPMTLSSMRAASGSRGSGQREKRASARSSVSRRLLPPTSSRASSMRQPAQRRVLVLRGDRVRVAGGQDVPEVRVLVLGLRRRRAHVADHRVPQRRRPATAPGRSGRSPPPPRAARSAAGRSPPGRRARRPAARARA